MSPEPFCGLALCLLNSFKDVLVQPFVSYRAAVALDIGVLLRLSGLDVLDMNAHLFSPCHQLAADIFRAVINPNNQRPASPLDDPVQTTHHPSGGQREVHLDAQALTVEIIQHA